MRISKGNIIKFMKENKIYFIIALTIVIILLVLAIVIFGKKEKNYVGNLINNGFVTRKGKWVYYTEEDGIYKENTKETKKISEDIAKYLNIEGKYLYFLEKSDEDKFNLVKMKINGKDKQTIVENIDDKMIMVDNGIIYYSQNDDLYKIKVNGKDRKKISSQNILSYQIKDNEIYYIYTEGKEYLLAKMNTDGTNSKDLETQCDINFYVKGNKIYYIKEEYNIEKYEYDYTLCSIQTNGKNKKEIVEISNKQKQINMAEDGIYYLTTENYEKYEIFKMKYNGENIVKVAETSINSKINIINKIVYYIDKQDDKFVIKNTI